MFTNDLQNRLKPQAMPTIFPMLESSSKQPDDHNYTLPPVVNIGIGKSVPESKVRILQDVTLTPVTEMDLGKIVHLNLPNYSKLKQCLKHLLL